MNELASARVLPLAALVGQDDLRAALLVAAVHPRLGGVLIRGHKGTAKSTAARGIAALLPDAEVVEGCRFGCPANEPDRWCGECQDRSATEPTKRVPPFVTVPLGVTEDQLVGTLDLERAVKSGETRFSPGLLAAANGGVLYVDEVNLLDDHIVDLLLDSAAMGVNVVAREGVRVSHPAEFMLIGTMNPEEGELRPQLLDRFGLCVEIRSVVDLAERAEIVARTLAFERDPMAFHEWWSSEQQALREQVALAREWLPHVEAPHELHVAAAKIALALEVHGHRADVLLVKTALGFAALDGRSGGTVADLERAAPLVLAHRLRRQPFDEEQTDPTAIAELARQALQVGSTRPSEKKK
ncbi:MAG: ATP-binding protein [Deltaproteobacteria bacterium]|nr:ATP-binding protein [Deltaproteobacteria bacterium]MBW2532743.1 ATP-binding protein [Deltaproteobacteria bacterium]